MTQQQLFNSISWQIIVFNLLLIVITFILFIMGGFDNEEFFATLTPLASISAIYIGTLARYIIKYIKEPDDFKDQKKETPYSRVIKWMIPVHFILLISIIGARAFTQITFKEMNQLLLFIETVYGGIIGNFISSLFYVENKPTHV